MTLARRRQIQFTSGHQVRTPVLLPSFSSKGFPTLQKIFEVMQEHISDEILVSAFDISEKKLKQDFDFASLVYLDSGGYEASKDLDLSDTHEKNYENQSWSLAKYESVIRQWTTKSPTVFVSYDGPETRVPYRQQIELAKTLGLPAENSARALLFKPESSGSTRHDTHALADAIRHSRGVQVIGVTEKEIGNSILSRMTNIARIRMAMDRQDDDRPIHVFGSLDTISTFLYFLAGADIFDGLTWLRYAFHDGDTLYRHAHGIISMPSNTNSDIIEASIWSANYRYTRNMLLTMRKFLVDRDFEHFGRHHGLILGAFQAMNAELEDGNGR